MRRHAPSFAVVRRHAPSFAVMRRHAPSFAVMLRLGEASRAGDASAASA